MSLTISFLGFSLLSSIQVLLARSPLIASVKILC